MFESSAGLCEPPTGDPVTVWLEDELPARMVYKQERWRVIDTPTPLMSEPDWLPPAITHAPMMRVGWRFTARSEESGYAEVFDIQKDDATWLVVHRFA